MGDKENLREIIRKRIDYHCDERKHDYRLGKACVDPLINDIIKDVYGAEPEVVISKTENKPLTLEELRGMDGEPVWVMFEDGSGARWGIVSVSSLGVCAVVADDTAYWFTDICKTITYRQKQEGEYV